LHPGIHRVAAIAVVLVIGTANRFRLGAFRRVDDVVAVVGACARGGIIIVVARATAVVPGGSRSIPSETTGCPAQPTPTPSTPQPAQHSPGRVPARLTARHLAGLAHLQASQQTLVPSKLAARAAQAAKRPPRASTRPVPAAHQA
jgi:hypothetical protein